MTDTAEHDRWFRQYRRSAPAGPLLVTFPHAGGSATFFLPYSRALGADFAVASIQYPGRQDRRTEKGIDSIDEYADRIAPVLATRADRPLVFFGHSMGAAIAFEVARRLEDQGITLHALFASGSRAPSRGRDEAVHLRDDDAVIAELTQLSGTNAQILGDPALLTMVLPALRSDYRAIETYRPRMPAVVNAPITVLTGDADPQVTAAEADAWTEHTTAVCSVRTYPGGHFFLVEHQQAILHLLRAELTRAANRR